MKKRAGFNMIEIMVAVAIIVLGVFPVYYLMTSGTRSTTVSVRETFAVNHAANVMELLTGFSYQNLFSIVKENSYTLKQAEGNLVYNNVTNQYDVIADSDSKWQEAGNLGAGKELLSFFNSKEVNAVLPNMERFYSRSINIECFEAPDSYCFVAVLMEWEDEKRPGGVRQVDLKTLVVDR